jgi:hypothetical protein
MSEYEWERPRVPRVNDRSGFGTSRRASRPIDHFVSLEFPRESTAWVLKGSSTGEEASPRTLPTPGKRFQGETNPG